MLRTLRSGRNRVLGARLGGLVLVGVAVLARPALAEGDHGSAQQFLYEEQVRAGSGGLQPAARPHHPAPTFRRILMQRGLSDQRQPGDRRAARSATPSAPPRVVAVLGDRFGQALASGLTDRAAATTSVLPLTSDDAGLARADFTDWLGSIRSRFDKPGHPDLAVVMLGSNDRQPIAADGSSVDVSDARWPALYAARVDALASVFSRARVPLIWVGLPSVHSDAVSADFVRLNGIVRDRVARSGGTYVDSWEAFADETGRYSPVGPDLDGDTVKLRKADGFGFTPAGSRKLASFVEGDIKRLSDAGAASPHPPASSDAGIELETDRTFDQALQVDVNAQIRREAGLNPEEPMSGPAAVERKPAAGPVIPLSAPLSPGGQLVGALPRDDPSPARQAAARLDGPKPGRTDDFSWPRR